jgi:hypothetical protein
MKIIITESQYRQYKTLLEQSVYDDDEDDGDYNDNFITNQPFDKEGMVVEGEISGNPIKFRYGEEHVTDDGEIEYYGEILYDNKKYSGLLSTDKRGYLVHVNFQLYFDEEIKLQNELKEMGLYFEFEHWLDSEVIPQIQD